MNEIKQAFAEHFGYSDFESMDTSDQRAFQWCVENFTVDKEDRNNFAISFAVWAIHDNQAKAYREAGITAYGLLEKYLDRPFINDPHLQ